MPLDTYEGFPRMNIIDPKKRNPIYDPFNTVARHEPSPGDASVPIPEPVYDPFENSQVAYESSLGWIKP